MHIYTMEFLVPKLTLLHLSWESKHVIILCNNRSVDLAKIIKLCWHHFFCCGLVYDSFPFFLKCFWRVNENHSIVFSFKIFRVLLLSRKVFKKKGSNRITELFILSIFYIFLKRIFKTLLSCCYGFSSSWILNSGLQTTKVTFH